MFRGFGVLRVALGSESGFGFRGFRVVGSKGGFWFRGLGVIIGRCGLC